MLQAEPSIAPGARPPESGDEMARGSAAFLSSLDCVIVEGPGVHPFPGAIEREAAAGVWTWIARDIAPEAARRFADAAAAGTDRAAAVETAFPEVLARLKAALDEEAGDRERQHRHTVQMGGEHARASLPYVVMAMRRIDMLEQALRFGRALGNFPDEAALAEALATITVSNPLTRALWMQAMVGGMPNPGRVMAAAVSLAGGAGETQLADAGYGPLVEAMLAHAQNQLTLLRTQPGLYGDVDRACKAVERFHRLTRALTYSLELGYRSAWGRIIADLTGRISERLEPPLRVLTADLTQALRRPREGEDRIDPGKVLDALNGLYLLKTVRYSRDSLAVNTVLDQVWTESAQALEVLVTRALDTYRADPADPVLRDRLDAGIKMAEIRFNPEYADILRRARDGAAQRRA